MILIATVAHTGTLWLRHALVALHGYEGVKLTHLHNPDVFEDAKVLPVYTTRRDILRTAASWANRGDDFDRWTPQWDAYVKLLKLQPLVFDFTGGLIQHGIQMPIAKFNQCEDKLKLHAALDAGDMDYFYSIVDPSLVSPYRKVA